MMQNLASNPKISWSTTTEVVMSNGFLYLIINAFIRLTTSAYRGNKNYYNFC